ncbi:MAG: VWA domain-containing protein [Deltaproteobacteria bacterium]|nr:VWA domain-containing protein [Deltaproteobacteria bacterium]
MQRMLPRFLTIFAVLCGACAAWADGSSITALSRGRALEAGALTLSRMEVRAVVDNGMATVDVLQIFRSHSGDVLEADYEFGVPDTGELSDFAIWDDGIRIPGVIIERRKAESAYNDLRARYIDPGLIETRDERDMTAFRCRIVPIPAYGTKRVELQYSQTLPVEGERLNFHFPSTWADDAMRAEVFEFELTVRSTQPIGDVEFLNDALVPEVVSRSDHEVVARLSMQNAPLTEDITAAVSIPTEKSDIVFLAYRDVEHVRRNPSLTAGPPTKDDTGFYGARVLFAPSAPTEAVSAKELVIALDTSLSMQWDKMTNAVRVIDHLVANLRDGDRVGLVRFDDAPQAMTPTTQPWSTETRANVGDWLTRQSLAGGTNYLTLFDAIAAQFQNAGPRRVVLLTDGAPTRATVKPDKILAAFEKSALAKSGTRTFVVGVGLDANRALLGDMAATGGGSYTTVSGTENFLPKARTLAAHLDAEPLEDVRLEFDGLAPVDMYPKRVAAAFAGGSVDFLGRYKSAASGKAVVRFVENGTERQIETAVELPDKSEDHAGLRRRWARARVDELLDLIQRDGEREEWIDEIIRLAKQHNFVTPYTSYLAAPRALLRPRVIRPGDPILRVKTDPSIREVVASFPFGLTQKMRYLPGEDIWQLRFLAPPGWPDGSYQCTLYLTGIRGERYTERKRFVIDGKPPTIHPRLPEQWRAGHSVEVVAAADADTRRLSAKVPYAGYVDLRYDHERVASVGRLDLPTSMPAGTHTIEWFAEDFAHNVTRMTTTIEILPDAGGAR